MNKQTLVVLKRARELITEPENWTTGYYAYTQLGDRCSELSESAVCWCSLGALSKADEETRGEGGRHYIHAKIQLAKTIELREMLTIPEFNDTKGHGAVLKMFDKTIERLSHDSSN